MRMQVSDEGMNDLEAAVLSTLRVLIQSEGANSLSEEV